MGESSFETLQKEISAKIAEYSAINGPVSSRVTEMLDRRVFSKCSPGDPSLVPQFMAVAADLQSSLNWSQLGAHRNPVDTFELKHVVTDASSDHTVGITATVELDGTNRVESYYDTKNHIIHLVSEDGDHASCHIGEMPPFVWEMGWERPGAVEYAVRLAIQKGLPGAVEVRAAVDFLDKIRMDAAFVTKLFIDAFSEGKSKEDMLKSLVGTLNPAMIEYKPEEATWSETGFIYLFRWVETGQEVHMNPETEMYAFIAVVGDQRLTLRSAPEVSLLSLREADSSELQTLHKAVVAVSQGVGLIGGI